jgi:hypothetical protein
MRRSIRISRGAQMVGALFLIAAIVSGMNGGLDGSGFVGGSVAIGILLIVGARVVEFMTKE